MNTTKKQQGDGFTIIEVVLVLAIAALIMLMVFIALPALQRNQRDTQRKDDVSRLQSQISNFKSRNRGSLSTLNTQALWQSFFNDEMARDGDSFGDPSGKREIYQAVYTGTGTASNPAAWDESRTDNMYIYPGASCQNENVRGTLSTSSRSVAIMKPLEGGGFQCLEA